jgi:acyl-[acyl-carrier-protein]-phospholipid O-acyltransferase/long-chain-fatty-acid--[acyl-carrier-protein] ligase
VPVNLNFTAGRAALEASIENAELRHCLTARLVEKKLNDFPWPEHVVHLDELLPRLKKQIVWWRIAVALLPAFVLTRVLGIPREGDRQEAFLLFTSGTSGAPKGVALTHRNLLGNVQQFAEMLNLDRTDAVLGSLPFFHSFGATVTILFPMMNGIRLVTYPNPLDVTKQAALIERYKITLVVTTPTFLRTYLRRVEPKQLSSIKLLVTGAEKLPADLAKRFRKSLGSKCCKATA